MLLWTPAVAYRSTRAVRGLGLPRHCQIKRLLCCVRQSVPPPPPSLFKGVKVHRWVELHSFSLKVDGGLPSERSLFAQHCCIVVNVESTFVSCRAEAPSSSHVSENSLPSFQTLLLRMNDSFQDTLAQQLTAQIPQSSPALSPRDHTHRRWRAIPLSVNSWGASLTKTWGIWERKTWL